MKKDSLRTIRGQHKEINLFEGNGNLPNILGYTNKDGTFTKYSNSMAKAVKDGIYKLGTPEKGGWFNISKADNPFSKMNIKDTATGIAKAAAPMIGNAINDGYSSGIGNTMLSLSSVAGMIPGPWGAIASVGLLTIGGLANRAFGVRVNQLALNDANSSISTANNFNSDASSMDSIGSGPAVGVGQVYKDGWFTNSASKKQAALENRAALALLNVYNSIDNNANNLVNDLMNLNLANFSAEGGSINLFKDGKNTNPIDLLRLPKRGLSDRKKSKEANTIISRKKNIEEGTELTPEEIAKLDKSLYDILYEDGDEIEFNTEKEYLEFVKQHPEFEYEKI